VGKHRPEKQKVPTTARQRLADYQRQWTEKQTRDHAQIVREQRQPERPTTLHKKPAK
jgi:hypothetical protein